METSRVIFFWISALIVSCASEDFKITPISTSSGLYYEKIGNVLLSNSKWHFVTSVDYQGYELFYEYLFTQARNIQEFCETVKLKECEDRYDVIQGHLDKIEKTDEAMANFLGITKRRQKRFWAEIGRFLSKVGRGLVGVVKTFIGGGSRQTIDLSVYDRQLGDLRNGQFELQNQMNLQRTMFLLDSERKNFRIEQLKKAQDDIQDKISFLDAKFQKDSEQKAKDIKELKDMLDETQEKIKRQEEIQKKLVGQVDKIEKTLLEVADDIKSIKESVADNAKRIDEQSLNIKLNSISINFGFLIAQFENEQKTLFEVVKNANKGDLDPYILTPLNLMQMLQDIYPNLPEDMNFPFYPNVENANKLYKIIEPSVYLYNNKVIFILQIPLVHAKVYRMHKVTSLPQPLGSNKFIFIQPQAPFLMIDKNYQEYSLMSSEDFKDSCKGIGQNKYLCKQVHQISLIDNDRECEVELYTFRNKIPSSCNARLLHLEKPIFLQLQQPTSWIYVVPDTELLTFNCGKNTSTIVLQGSGFIEVTGDCILRTPRFELLSLLEFSNLVESNYSAHVNLSDYIDKTYVEEIEEKSKIRKQIILPFDLEGLNNISFSLKRPGTNMAGLYYTILVVAIAAVCIFVYLVYKKKIKVKKVDDALYYLRKKMRSQFLRREDPERPQIKLQLNKGEDVKNISVRQEASTDPESEYVTVRFKVKKQEYIQDNKESNKGNVKFLSNHQPEPNVPGPKMMSEDDVYLNDLRKLKPNKNIYV